MTYLEQGTQMHKYIERCLAFMIFLHRSGFKIGGNDKEVTFALDTSPGATGGFVCGLRLAAQEKPDWYIPAGEIEGLTLDEISAQWKQLTTAWNKDPKDPAGLSEIERRVIMEMHLPKQVLLGLTVQLVVKGYDCAGIPQSVIDAVKKDLKVLEPLMTVEPS